jgi:hypothetical protein
MFHAGIGQVSLEVLPHLGPVQLRQFALQINALPDRGVRLETEPVPELALPDQALILFIIIK